MDETKRKKKHIQPRDKATGLLVNTAPSLKLDQKRALCVIAV